MSDAASAGMTDARATRVCSSMAGDGRPWWIATDVTDYWVRLGALLHRFIPDLGDLLSLEPDEGGLGPTLVPPDRYRRGAAATSSSVGARTQAIADGCRCDTVLVTGCAITQPRPLVERCLSVAERAVVWVVPADDGYPNLAPPLSGCLPPSLLPEPGPTTAERLLSALTPGYFPNVFSSTPWSQMVRAADQRCVVDEIAESMCLDPNECTTLRRELARRTRTATRGIELETIRCSAVLIWYTA